MSAVASERFEKVYVFRVRAIGDDNWIDVDPCFFHSLHHQKTGLFVVLEHDKDARYSLSCDYIVKESITDVLDIEALAV